MTIFEKYILKQLMGPITYNEQSAVITAQMQPLSQDKREAIHREGEKWKLAPQQVKETIDRVQQNFTQWSNAQERQAGCGAFDLNALPEGTQVNLTAHDRRLDTEVVLQLLHLGRHDGAATPRLLVLGSTRTTLLPGDEVEPHADAYFSVGHALLLRVYRQGRRFPDGQRVMHLDRITDLTQLMPSPLCEVADGNRTFTHDEQAVSEQRGAYSLGRNPMSLLLHSHSQLMPVYADFTDDPGERVTTSAAYACGNAAALTTEQSRLLFGQRAGQAAAQPKGSFRYVEADHKLGFLPH